MARRLAVFVSLLAPALAFAQTITITESNDQDKIVNISECSGGVTDQLSFTWVVSDTTSNLDLWASNQASCPQPSTSNTSAKTVSIRANIAAGTTSLSNVITVPSLLSQLSISCPGSSTAVNFCLFPAGTTTTTAATGSLALDLQTPPAPVANDPTPGDSALNVSWSQGTGTAEAGTSGAPDSYNIYCDLHGISPITRKCATVTGGGTTSARVDGLTNGTQYDVQVTATTIGGNESARSDTVSGTPVPVDDFWRLYKSDGGQEQGGCAGGAAGLVALLALLPLALRRRRS
jgi:Synergist-CTERM protein sorting domain-containing protein